MEIVDANAGLVSNFELYDLLMDPARNNYPPYEVYQEKVALQRARETAVSFLTSAEVRVYESEAAEALLTAHQSAAQGADVAAATAAAAATNPAAAAAAAALAKHTPRHRDYKPLEGTCWLKARVLNYLKATPAATQTEQACKDFVEQAQKLLADNAAQRAKDGAAAAGRTLTPAQLAAAVADVRLTTCELLQLVNLRPASLVEVHRAIEECEERLTEQDAQELLELIQRVLPQPPPREQQAQQEEEPQEGEAAAAAEGAASAQAAASEAKDDSVAPMEQ